MSMLSRVGLNKSLPIQNVARVAIPSVRGLHAARPVAVKASKPREFGGPLIHPGGSYIKGTVNDPAEYPPPNPSHGSYHWAFERLIAVSLVPMFAVATVKHGACGVLDGSLSAALILHSHMGFEQVLVDYVDKRKFPKAGPISKWVLRAATVAAAVGLYEFNTSMYY